MLRSIRNPIVNGSSASRSHTGTSHRHWPHTPLNSVPLSALALSVGGGGTRLLCRVPRHHAPLGVSPDAPLQLEFDELWRCAAAKSQLEAACTAARAEQHRKLVSMLGTAGPQAGEKAIQRA